MSLAQDLEIYKSADSLVALALQVQAQVPRVYRLAVGQRISNEAVEILLTVGRANAARGASREQHIARLLEQLEATRALLRAAHACKAIPTKVWAQSIELTDSVGKQATGWLKATSRSLSAGTVPA